MQVVYHRYNNPLHNRCRCQSRNRHLRLRLRLSSHSNTLLQPEKCRHEGPIQTLNGETRGIAGMMTAVIVVEDEIMVTTVEIIEVRHEEVIEVAAETNTGGGRRPIGTGTGKDT